MRPRREPEPEVVESQKLEREFSADQKEKKFFI